jgi:hypothetical protein
MKASKRWKSSGTRSGECVSIFADGTRVPFAATRTPRTRKPRIVEIRETRVQRDAAIHARIGATNEMNPDN